MKKNFVSNSSESSRMFKSNVLEALSKVHVTVPLILFIPIIGFLFINAIQTEPVSVILIASSGGIVFWTWTEYVLHRFVFHFEPQSQWGKRLHFIFHGIHHDYPNDRLRLVMPPSVSLPLALLFYLLFRIVLPAEYLSAFTAAFLAGYLFYDMSHYAIHHLHFKSRFWKRMKNHHMQHHYLDPTKGYGVTSSLWDKILFSDFRKSRQTRK